MKGHASTEEHATPSTELRQEGRVFYCGKQKFRASDEDRTATWISFLDGARTPEAALCQEVHA